MVIYEVKFDISEKTWLSEVQKIIISYKISTCTSKIGLYLCFSDVLEVKNSTVSETLIPVCSGVNQMSTILNKLI